MQGESRKIKQLLIS